MPQQDDISAGWDELYPPAGPREESLLEKALAERSLVIGTRDNVLVTIGKDGDLKYGPNYEPDEAARMFWEALQRQKAAENERELLIAHMEGILTALGAADLHNEARSNLLSAHQTTANLMAAHAAQASLERAMHQAIELGRALTRRPEIARVPVRLPRALSEDPLSSYEGQRGMGEQPDPAEFAADDT